MKKTLILLLIVSSFKLVAQHADLQQRWYVQSLTINNVATVIPNDPIDFPYAYLNFLGFTTNLTISENETVNGNCQIGFTSHVSYISTNAFGFVDFTPFYTDTECSTSLIDFMNLYVGFYEDYVTEQFIYSITTETDNGKTLSVTNNNGDIIIYTNSFFNSAPQEFIGNVWYLHNLVIDGVDNIPPNNTELSEIILNFNIEIFSTSACYYVDGGNYFDYTLSQFYLYETGVTLSTCGSAYPENNTFSDLYIIGFYLNSLGPFNYEYTINGSVETLTITNSLGNQAIYGNYTLSIQDYLNSVFSIYPNPVNDVLNIKNNEATVINNIKIYNLLGKLVLIRKISNGKIDLSILERGIYILKIETEKGNLTSKIVKK